MVLSLPPGRSLPPHPPALYPPTTHLSGSLQRSTDLSYMAPLSHVLSPSISRTLSMHYHQHSPTSPSVDTSISQSVNCHPSSLTFLLDGALTNPSTPSHPHLPTLPYLLLSIYLLTGSPPPSLIFHLDPASINQWICCPLSSSISLLETTSIIQWTQFHLLLISLLATDLINQSPTLS